MNNTFTSQAVNFVSSLQTGVDPRTGQYFVNIPLVEINANNQLGPMLPLSLNYSSLSDNNSGFGIGFSLGLTSFNNLTNILTLSNGEKYRVIPGTDMILYGKVKNIIFSYTNGVDDSQGYVVKWKDGKIEYLKIADDRRTFVLDRSVSPLGHELLFEWGWNGSIPLLLGIRDKQRDLRVL